MNTYKYKKIIGDYISKFNRYYSSIRGEKYYVFLKEYLPLILSIFFVLYIAYSLSNSEIKSFEIKNFKFLLRFFFYAFSITPLFLILSSIRFNLIKILFNIKTTFKQSLQSVLIASSIDAFTPAKINDFARLKNEKKRKKVFLGIILERLTDFYVLTIFALLSNFNIKIIAIVLFSILIICLLDLFILKLKINFKHFSLFLLSVFITCLHWNLAFTIFKKAFFSFSNTFYYDYELINNVITIKKFSLMTLISVLPIGFGGFGLREVSALGIFNNIDSSLVLFSTFIYGLAVSGILTFIGISYVNIRKIFFK